MHRVIPLSIAACLFVGSSAALAVNENTTIVLHARDGFAPCDDPQQQGICVDRPPTLDLSGMQMPWVYVMLRNYDHLGAIWCAFDWPLEWTYLGGAWDCQQDIITLIQPSAPGPVTGQLLQAFDCVQGGSLATIGRMIFAPPSDEGCLSLIHPNHPFGIHVAACDGVNETSLPLENTGRVCAGPGGYDACLPASTPVESVTWGAIKGQYR